MKIITILILFIILLNKRIITCEKPVIREVNLDESKTSRLKLTITWIATQNEKLDRFLLEYDKIVLNTQRFSWETKPVIISDARKLVNSSFESLRDKKLIFV